MGGSQTTVVITTFNHLQFLQEALESCINQTVPAEKIIVVDDGSMQDPSPLVSRFEAVQLIRQANRGLAAARNAGIRACDTSYVIFLDDDDRLLPEAIEAGTTALIARPDAALAYGAYYMIDAGGQRTSKKLLVEPPDNPYFRFLTHGNFVGMHATVIYRRSCLLNMGGFDENFRCCEDYELFLRIARTHQLARHETPVAEYRWHQQNMSDKKLLMFRAATEALKRENLYVGDHCELREAIRTGMEFWREFYSLEIAKKSLRVLKMGGLSFHAVRLLAASLYLAPLPVLKFIASEISSKMQRGFR
jgi:glycosyltransferase involved in cell wall biosynthesis